MCPIKYPQSIKTKIELQGEIDTIIRILGGFSILFALIDRSSTHKKTSEDIEELNTIYKLFRQQIFIAYFLCMRSYSKCARHMAVNNSCPHRVYALVEGNR